MNKWIAFKVSTRNRAALLRVLKACPAISETCFGVKGAALVLANATTVTVFQAAVKGIADASHLTWFKDPMVSKFTLAGEDSVPVCHLVHEGESVIVELPENGANEIQFLMELSSIPAHDITILMEQSPLEAASTKTHRKRPVL